MYLEFVLVRYGKLYRHGNDCPERSFYVPRFPRSRRHSMLCMRATRGGTRVGQEAEEKTWAGALIVVFEGKTGRGRVSWFSVNNFNRLVFRGYL